MMKTTQKQFKPGKILLAVDGSPSSKAAAYAAIQLASKMQWDLHALYIVDVTDVFDIYTDTSKELSELEEETLRERKVGLFKEQGSLALTEIEGICQGMNIPVTTEIRFGGVPEIILKASKGYSLLSIGRRGNRHVKDSKHLGSNFQQIAHHARIPLLIGDSHYMPRKFQRALLAYDGSELSREAVKWGETLSGLFKAVTVLAVEKENERDHTWLADRHEEIAASALTQYGFIQAAGNPGRMVASKALAEGADLILMGAYQHTNLLRWARHSTIDTVLRETDLPVLAIK